MGIYSIEKAKEEYTRWKNKLSDNDLLSEMETIKDNEDDIFDRFCKDIAFGTSGIRGEMGVGTNRINQIVLKRATKAVARFLIENNTRPKMVVGYDTRINSKRYGEIVAETFAKAGIDVYLFSEPTPVPVISFAVRHLSADGAIVITASHNPKQYNGYKVYDNHGNQIDEDVAEIIEGYIGQIDLFENECKDMEGLVTLLNDEVKNSYLKRIHKEAIWWDEKAACEKWVEKLSICYTSLNGAGRDYTIQSLKDIGVKKLNLVEIQLPWDGNFPTCPFPNPELEECYEKALLVAESLGDNPLILATDPDSDRLGVMAYDGNSYKRLNGNQIGVLLIDYICQTLKSTKELENNKYVICKSLVSTPMANKIGADYGVDVVDVFTGFKYIAKTMEELANDPRKGRFLFGFEESLGYLYGDYARDKDAVMAAKLVCLMAAKLLSQGKSLWDRLDELNRIYGYHYSSVHSYIANGELGKIKIQELMIEILEGKLKNTESNLEIFEETCYKDKLVYAAKLKDESSFVIRPSGTEPKLKLYVFTKGDSKEEAQNKGTALYKSIDLVIGGSING